MSSKRYKLRMPEDIEDQVKSWNLPSDLLSHLSRESESSRLTEPPFEALQTLSSVANRYRWTVVSKNPAPTRLDFVIEVDEPSAELRIIRATCIQSLGETAPIATTEATRLPR